MHPCHVVLLGWSMSLLVAGVARGAPGGDIAGKGAPSSQVVLGREVTMAGAALTVRTSEPDIVVTSENAGRSIRIFDQKTGRSVELDRAKLESLLLDAIEAVQLRGQLTLRREGSGFLVVRTGRPAPARPAPPASPAPSVPSLPPGAQRRLEGHRGPVTSVEFAPDGRCALSAGADDTIRIWDLNSGVQVRQMDGSAARYSPDGRYILGVDGQRLRLWETHSGKEVRTYADGNPMRALVFLPQGDRFLGAGFVPPGARAVVRTWETATGKELGGFPQPMEFVQHLAVSADGRRAVCAGGFFTTSDTPLGPLARVWDLQTDKTIWLFRV